MKWPERVQLIVEQMISANKALANSTEDNNRRLLTLMIAEQVCFEFGISWGTKRADPGRPPSKDSLTFNDPVTSRLWNFDYQNGSTRAANIFPEAEDITGQIFIRVNPVDHLETGTGTTTPPPPSTPTPVPTGPGTGLATRADIDKLFERLDNIQAAVAALAQAVGLLNTIMEQVHQSMAYDNQAQMGQSQYIIDQLNRGLAGRARYIGDIVLVAVPPPEKQ